MLVETDSPVLGPNPNRRNEPVNISISIKAIAELKNTSEQDVIETMWENTQKLYGNIL
jgi:TatD DNase family protein